MLFYRMVSARLETGKDRMAAMLRRLTTERAAIIIVFLLLFAMAARIALDPDMWWHIRLGQRIRETGESVYADGFSHTHTGVVHKNHSGLAQVLLYACWIVAGYLGLTLFVSVTAVGGMFLIYRAGSGSIYMQGFVLVLGAACASAYWSPRPQMFTFFLAAALLLMLMRLKRRGSAPLWLLPLLMWLWGNLHGGYIVGYVFIVAFIAGEGLNNLVGASETAVAPSLLRRLCGVSLLSLLLLPLNPLGLSVFAVPFETVGISDLRSFIQEWKPPDFAQPITWSLVLLLALFLASVWGSRRRIDFSEWLLVAVTLIMALYSVRHFSLFAIATVPAVTRRLDTVLMRRGWTIRRRTRETPRRVVLNLVLISLVALGALAQVRYVSSANTVDQALRLNYPVSAVEYLNASDLEGNLLNSYNWGGYLIFEASGFPVFIDGRTDLYRDFLAEYTSAAFGTPAWSDVLDRHDIGIVLIETGGALAARLDTDSNWLQAYQDAMASIFIRL